MNYYNEIKNRFINNEAYKQIKDYSKNRYELNTYYEVGKLLVEAQGGEERARYGDGLIKEYSKRLTRELGKGYSERNLKYMRKFYIFQKGQPLAAQLTWSHYIILLSIKNIDKINYYIDQIIRYNLGKRQLQEKIKSNEYERLDEKTRNKLVNKERLTISDEIKHPIIIKNKYYTKNITERMLKEIILERIDDFLNELGEGYAYIGNEYKIKLGNNYNYIDLLLFNIKYNSYVVIELKVTELKKEHIGQIDSYMNYIDKNIKTIYHNKTIGIIIAKRDNSFVIEYCSNKNIFNTTYELVSND